MSRVRVLIFLVTAAPSDTPLVRLLADARARLAEYHVAAFRAAGADDVRIVAGPADDLPFGRRLADLVRSDPAEGLVVLGAGAIPLASGADLQLFLEAATAHGRRALANNRYSADAIALSSADVLAELPDLPGDNALPRWLAERAGFEVRDLRSRWRLQVDLDSPLDLILLGRAANTPRALRDVTCSGAVVEVGRAVGDRLALVGDVMADLRAELVVAGRTSASTIRWLELRVACRVRALVEERGLRAASGLAQGQPPARLRPPRSVVGLLLDRDGPESFGAHVAELADAALVDTRVILAHRLGADERSWPSAEDRFASDLLAPQLIADPWLRALTQSALNAPIPILLGGHSLVGPGVRLVARAASRLSTSRA